MRLKLLLPVLIVAGIALGAVALMTQPLVLPEASSAPEVLPARLQQHVRYLSVDVYPRSADRVRNLERAAEYIIKEFKASGAQTAVQEVKVGETAYKNVIARFGPSAGPLMVIGAHYDSHGDAEQGARLPQGYGPDTHTPGADDNASGVAGLIELAYLLGRNPPPHPVELVAYTLEEPPHFRTGNMGSAWHARSLVKAGRPVRLMLSLEMLGYFSDAPGSQSFPVPGMNLFYPDRGNFIALVGGFGDAMLTRRVKALMAGATDLPVYSINGPSVVPGIDFSDHLSYWAENMPALMITDTSFYRNTNYHLSGDTYDRLDYRRMAKVVQGAYAVVQRF